MVAAARNVDPLPQFCLHTDESGLHTGQFTGRRGGEVSEFEVLAGRCDLPRPKLQQSARGVWVNSMFSVRRHPCQHQVLRDGERRGTVYLDLCASRDLMVDIDQWLMCSTIPATPYGDPDALHDADNRFVRR